MRATSVLIVCLLTVRAFAEEPPPEDAEATPPEEEPLPNTYGSEQPAVKAKDPEVRWRPPSRLGIGVSLGAPVGGSVELVLARPLVIDAAIGRNAFDEQRTTGHVMLALTVKEPRVALLQLPIYVGAGAAVDEGADRRFARFAIGLRGQGPIVAFQLFAEAAYRLGLSDVVESSAEAAVGFRYFL